MQGFFDYDEFEKMKLASLNYYNGLVTTVKSQNLRPGYLNSGIVCHKHKINYSSYEQHEQNHAAMYVFLIEEFGIKLEQKNVLEIGCGFGRGCNFLKNIYNPLSVTGIDMNDKLLNVARDNFSSIEFISSNVTELDKLNRVFDVVVTIETVPNWIMVRESYKNIAHSLTSGGDLLIASDIKRTKFMSGQFTNIFEEYGLQLIDQVDITNNVVKAVKQLTELVKTKEQEQYLKHKLYLLTHKNMYISQHYKKR